MTTAAAAAVLAAVMLGGCATSGPRPSGAEGRRTSAPSPTPPASSSVSPTPSPSRSTSSTPRHPVTSPRRATSSRPPVVSPARPKLPPRATFDASSAIRLAASYANRGYTVSYALCDANGALVTGRAVGYSSYGASITKVLILAAYLRQLGTASLSGGVRADLTAMMRRSDNAAANRMWSRLHSPASQVRAVAQAAGMSGFVLDTSDKLYVLGQSRVTAGGLAALFGRVLGLVPQPTRNFAASIGTGEEPAVGLATVLPTPQFGKLGYKPEPSGGYVFNQAARFRYADKNWSLAVVVRGGSGPDAGAAISAALARALTRR